MAHTTSDLSVESFRRVGYRLFALPPSWLLVPESTSPQITDNKQVQAKFKKKSFCTDYAIHLFLIQHCVLLSGSSPPDSMHTLKILLYVSIYAVVSGSVTGMHTMSAGMSVGYGVSMMSLVSGRRYLLCKCGAILTVSMFYNNVTVLYCG